MKTKKWSELFGSIHTERREKIERRTAEAAKEMPLHRLREARRFTRKQLADAMQLDQTRAVSRRSSDAPTFM